MINSIEPKEFLTMLPTYLMEECKQFRITDQQIMDLCQCLNDMRAGNSLTVKVTPQRLGSLDLRNSRFTDTDTGRTFLIRFAKHNLHRNLGNWKVEMIKDLNFLSTREGSTVWHIRKAPGKVFPLAYKEFLKCKFQGLHMPTINKLDMFYDSYVKNYNAIYQDYMDQQNQLQPA